MKKLMKKNNLKPQTIEAYNTCSCSCSCNHCAPIPTHAVGEQGVSDGGLINSTNRH